MSQPGSECFCLDSSLPCQARTACGHSFHDACLLGWLLRGKNSCPVCRATLVALPQAEQHAPPRPAQQQQPQQPQQQPQLPQLPNYIGGAVDLILSWSLRIYNRTLLLLLLLQYGMTESPLRLVARFWAHDHWLRCAPLLGNVAWFLFTALMLVSRFAVLCRLAYTAWMHPKRALMVLGALYILHVTGCAAIVSRWAHHLATG